MDDITPTGIIKMYFSRPIELNFSVLGRRLQEAEPSEDEIIRQILKSAFKI